MADEKIVLRGFPGFIVAVGVLTVVGACFLIPFGFFATVCWAIVTIVKHFCN